MCFLCLAHSGYYWIDPNEGCINDAEYIFCDFENKRACVDPKKENVSLPNADHICALVFHMREARLMVTILYFNILLQYNRAVFT